MVRHMLSFVCSGVKCGFVVTVHPWTWILLYLSNERMDELGMQNSLALNVDDSILSAVSGSSSELLNSQRLCAINLIVHHLKSYPFASSNIPFMCSDIAKVNKWRALMWLQFSHSVIQSCLTCKHVQVLNRRLICLCAALLDVGQDFLDIVKYPFVGGAEASGSNKGQDPLGNFNPDPLNLFDDQISSLFQGLGRRLLRQAKR